MIVTGDRIFIPVFSISNRSVEMMHDVLIGVK